MSWHPASGHVNEYLVHADLPYMRVTAFSHSFLGEGKRENEARAGKELLGLWGNVEGRTQRPTKSGASKLVCARAAGSAPGYRLIDTQSYQSKLMPASAGDPNSQRVQHKALTCNVTGHAGPPRGGSSKINICHPDILTKEIGMLNRCETLLGILVGSYE